MDKTWSLICRIEEKQEFDKLVNKHIPVEVLSENKINVIKNNRLELLEKFIQQKYNSMVTRQIILNWKEMLEFNLLTSWKFIEYGNFSTYIPTKYKNGNTFIITHQEVYEIIDKIIKEKHTINTQLYKRINDPKLNEFILGYSYIIHLVS
jgi:hypothetical protein